MSIEPTPLRDNGPYRDRAQARAQYDATAYGIPTTSTAELAAMSEVTLTEALLLAGVQPSRFEAEVRAALTRQLDPDEIQVIAGWLIRAHLAGADRDPVR